MIRKALKLTFVFFFLAVICQATPITIKVKLANPQLYPKIFLYQTFGSQLIKYDSASLKDGIYTLSFGKQIPRGFYRIGPGVQQSFALILGKESLQVEADLKNIETSVRFSGSLENEIYQRYLAVTKEISEKSVLLNKEVQSAQQHGNVEALKSIQLRFDSLQTYQNTFYKGIYEDHPTLFMAKIARFFHAEKTVTAEDFLKPKFFSDIELTRGDMLQGKIFAYYQRFVPRNVEDWLVTSEELISKTEAGSPIREVVYLSLVNLFHYGASDNVWNIARKYQNEYSESRFMKVALQNLPKPTPQIGEMAPDIELPDQHGEMKKLSSLRGQMVLVDFWASWCGPCRKENPNVVKAFHKYKDKGFTVLGVSLDKSKDRWVNAIESDKLDWNHISDLKGWNSAGAAQYNVRSIPAAYLVDQEGRIVAKNLRGKALEETLEELLNNN
ncbi:TlpA disulfide reductase family protein [Fulvivirgaceae bacterium BMA10]|uniref:TlpA disulfide reductase family protein n=1 Tax=Splendidivirga corallicola TaxID=3051826 RepID=A0ABT8KJ74_9BACT|nr:TlpA disulfide reductase family protein [Fulvivirgaceae bacterium BMA10]